MPVLNKLVLKVSQKLLPNSYIFLLLRVAVLLFVYECSHEDDTYVN